MNNMNIVHDDIWSYLDTHWICITTNQGWNRSGENVMGRGLALQAAQRYPDLPFVYGKICQNDPGTHRIEPVVFLSKDMVSAAHLLMFPTKRLNASAPWMSWKSKSDTDLITECLVALNNFTTTTDRPVALPAVGTANGGLDQQIIV